MDSLHGLAARLWEFLQDAPCTTLQLYLQLYPDSEHAPTTEEFDVIERYLDHFVRKGDVAGITTAPGDPMLWIAL